LIGGYFHQDWSGEFDGSPQAALAAFIAPAVRKLRQAPRSMPLVEHDDLQLAQILDRFGHDFDHAYDGCTARSW
jgi:hypothetical protein